MKISVIIPTYNRCETLQRALWSVLSQSLLPLEIIVIDDGSTDTTASIVTTEFPQVKYLTQTNQGVSAARNTGIMLATGDWLAFLDSDDTWHPQKLELQAAALNAEQTYRISHTNEHWNRNGVLVNPPQKYTKQGGWMFQHCLAVCALSPSTVMIHREVFEAVGGFDPNLPACEDYDLWLRICARYPVLLLNQTLSTKYAGHDDQLSYCTPSLDQYRVQALAKILESQTLSPDNQHAALTMLRQKANIFQQGALKRGKYAEAAHYEQLLAHYACG